MHSPNGPPCCCATATPDAADALADVVRNSCPYVVNDLSSVLVPWMLAKAAVGLLRTAASGPAGAGARRVDTNQIAPDRRIDRDFGRRRRPYNVSQLLSLEGGYQAMRNIRVNDEVFNRAKAAGY